MAVFFIHTYRGDRGGDLLDQGQPLFPVLFVCRFISSSRVEPRRPLLFQVAMDLTPS